ncbi:MAG: adaptor protein MecA [Ruminococcus sp.]|nr:adaptor protein MecA [Ruminococcus sp.]MBR0302380.1 adaptor protein MecA [Clostridia bacterium]
MTFEKLGEDRVLITLRQDDIKTLGLEIEKLSVSNPEHEKKLRKLLLLACFDTGIDAKGKRFLLEALPCKTGYLLLLYAQRVHSGKRYRVKTPKTLPACVFYSHDHMLDGLRALSVVISSIPSNTLYEYQGLCVLVFSYPMLPKQAERILSEYGSIKELSALQIAHIGEHGKVLIRNNAVAAFRASL